MMHEIYVLDSDIFRDRDALSKIHDAAHARLIR